MLPRFPFPLRQIRQPLAQAGVLIRGISVFCVLTFSTGEVSAALLDTLKLGDAGSEKSHGFEGSNTEVVPQAGLGEPARRLLPLEPVSWEGGRIAFTLAVDPEQVTYVTAKLWGSDVSSNKLILFCDGLQIGYRHLGDYDLLDIGSTEPFSNGRYYYNTLPLPLNLTKGKRQVRLEVRSNGPIWGYGNTWESYQKPLEKPTRPLFAIYTHTDGAFVPPPHERQGEVVAQAPVRSSPGPEVIDAVKARLTKTLNEHLASKKPLSQEAAQLVGHAYHVAWSPAYRNPTAVAQIIASADKHYRDFCEDRKVVESGWTGAGLLADAVRHVAPGVRLVLDEKISDGQGGKITRRAAWSELFVASRDWHRRHRRMYTNQTMIKDLYGIYLANRALQVVDPAAALPEPAARRYFYEAVGLEPWRDSDLIGKAKSANSGWTSGPGYWQFTAKGLSKELGYVGNYGEVLDWAAHIYLATAEPGRPETGDPRLKEALAKMEHARAYFRYPALDADGNRAMRLQTVVGWRDIAYPGDVCYAERSAAEGSGLFSAAVTRTPQAIGAVQQMFADNQFFASVKNLMGEWGQRASVPRTLLHVPDQYALFLKAPTGRPPLPMAPGQPDFVFADEENGVLALKRGDEILYASLYWRARYAINFLARVHFITPDREHVATVRQQEEFEPSGLVYTRPDWVNLAYHRGGVKYPGNLRSAHAGEALPIATIPQGVRFEVGDENPAAGRASYYCLRYGDYLIGMNASTKRTFSLETPNDAGQALNLSTRKPVAPGTVISVPPRTTVVLWLGKS